MGRGVPRRTSRSRVGTGPQRSPIDIRSAKADARVDCRRFAEELIALKRRVAFFVKRPPAPPALLPRPRRPHPIIFGDRGRSDRQRLCGEPRPPRSNVTGFTNLEPTLGEQMRLEPCSRRLPPRVRRAAFVIQPGSGAVMSNTTCSPSKPLLHRLACQSRSRPRFATRRSLKLSSARRRASRIPGLSRCRKLS